MKKFAPIVAVALLGMMFTSCKKSYTCSCKTSAGVASGSYTYPKAKKSDAQAACDVWNNAAALSGGSCSL
jgi:hypothetical protein